MIRKYWLAYLFMLLVGLKTGHFAARQVFQTNDPIWIALFMSGYAAVSLLFLHICFHFLHDR